MSDWTEERVALLIKMHADRELSCSQMGDRLGGLTRNAVIGKLHRLGLYNERKKTGGAGAVRAARVRTGCTNGHHLAELNFTKRERAKRQQNSTKARSKREAHAQELREQFQTVEITELPPDQSAVAVKHSKLTDKICHWPVSGDARDLDAMLFCGDTANGDYPYCVRHCRMAYVKPQRPAQVPSYEYRRRA